MFDSHLEAAEKEWTPRSQLFETAARRLNDNSSPVRLTIKGVSGRTPNPYTPNLKTTEQLVKAYERLALSFSPISTRFMNLYRTISTV